MSQQGPVDTRLEPASTAVSVSSVPLVQDEDGYWTIGAPTDTPDAYVVQDEDGYYTADPLATTGLRLVSAPHGVIVIPGPAGSISVLPLAISGPWTDT